MRQTTRKDATMTTTTTPPAVAPSRCLEKKVPLQLQGAGGPWVNGAGLGGIEFPMEER